MVNKIMKDVHWQIIANYMESNKDFACGNVSVVTGKMYKKMWQELADQLNSAGYGEKSVKKWQKSWSDFKFSLKKKANRIMTGTGDDSQDEKLSETEIKMLNILGDSFCNGLDEKLQNSDEINITNLLKRPLEGNDDVDEEEVEGIITNQVTKDDHDYLFLTIPHQKKKIKTDNSNLEQMYENTITMLETINQTLDTRLTELNENVNKLAEILKKNADNNATICNVAASIAASSEVMAKVTSDFISYFRDKKN